MRGVFYFYKQVDIKMGGGKNHMRKNILAITQCPDILVLCATEQQFLHRMICKKA